MVFLTGVRYIGYVMNNTTKSDSAGSTSPETTGAYFQVNLGAGQWIDVVAASFAASLEEQRDAARVNAKDNADALAKAVAELQEAKRFSESLKAHADKIETGLTRYADANDMLKARVAELEKRVEGLTGLKFSDRNWHALKSRAEEAEAKLAAYEKFKDAVEDAASDWHCFDGDPSPREILKRVIKMNVIAALDPAVSEEAQKLRDTYKAENDMLKARVSELEPKLAAIKAHLTEVEEYNKMIEAEAKESLEVFDHLKAKLARYERPVEEARIQNILECADAIAPAYEHLMFGSDRQVVDLARAYRQVRQQLARYEGAEELARKELDEAVDMLKPVADEMRGYPEKYRGWGVHFTPTGIQQSKALVGDLMKLRDWCNQKRNARAPKPSEPDNSKRKIYHNSPEYRDYLSARFVGTSSTTSFEFDGHRWVYEVTSFDDKGDYDLIWRKPSEPSAEGEVKS